MLIVSEDNGPELGCYGDPHARTPNLERLAAAGVRFNLSAEQPELVAKLHGQLDAWRRDVGAQMMELNPDYDPAVELKKKGKKK